MTKNEALDRKAENARELGLDYEPEQKSVAFEKTVCPFCTSEWVTAEQHERNVDRVERLPLTNGEIYTAYITATNQTLRPQDERLALAFARAIEAAHGIKG